MTIEPFWPLLTIHYTTADGTAAAGKDYEATEGSLKLTDDGSEALEVCEGRLHVDLKAIQLIRAQKLQSHGNL